MENKEKELALKFGKYVFDKQNESIEYLFQSFLAEKEEVKYSNPLFISADGFEIFKNQEYWGVYTKDFRIEYVEDGISYDIPYSIGVDAQDEDYRTFAKKENAEKFITENKKQFSISDVKNVLNEIDDLISIDYLINKLCK